MEDKKPDPFAPEDERIPRGFPDNVNPSKANIKAFEDQMEADRKATEDGKLPDYTEERVGEGIRHIPTNEREPEASPPGKSQVKRVRQTKTVSK